jgi:hypothetical protein
MLVMFGFKSVCLIVVFDVCLRLFADVSPNSRLEIDRRLC